MRAFRRQGCAQPRCVEAAEPGIRGRDGPIVGNLASTWNEEWRSIQESGPVDQPQWPTGAPGEASVPNPWRRITAFMLSPRPGTPPLCIPPFARVLALRADMELCIDTVAQSAMCAQECELTSCCAPRARADIVLRMKIFRRYCAAHEYGVRWSYCVSGNAWRCPSAHQDFVIIS